MGAISFITQQGAYFCAISPTPDTNGNYTLMVK
jgi:hypothetical protein